MTHIPRQSPSVEQLQREIAQLKLQIQSQVTDVNDVAPLWLRVQQLTTQAALNPEVPW